MTTLLFAPPVEKRLQDRYTLLVQEHLRSAGKLTNGLGALPGVATAFASTQAAWRFYANDRVRLPSLVVPLQAAAAQALAGESPDWALVLHDRSTVKYPGHTSKTDQAVLSHGGDRGYELTTALLVAGDTGQPLAPLELHWRTATAVYSTRQPAPAPEAFWLDEVLPTMQAVAALGLPCRLVHVIDREADSVGHFRAWADAEHTFLVRADAEPRVCWQGVTLSVGVVAERLAADGGFRRSRAVDYQGQPAWQEVAETTVVLERPAWPHRRSDSAPRRRVPGAPLTLRLVVSRVFTDAGLVATWLLLTNAPASVAADLVALWYYWRWRIESFFKLLKSAGQQLEHWQQESGEALAKRLLVAAMACVVVWRLERHPSPEAAAVRQVLVRLSGRQRKWGRESTAPALLAGLWVLLAALAALEQYTEAELRAMKHLVLPGCDTG
jgi:hypothetical protein